MRLTWVSGNGDPQEVYYDGGRTSTSTISTFTPSQMCSELDNPASGFGWHDPGYIHTALMTQLTPSSSYSYYYGRSEFIKNDIWKIYANHIQSCFNWTLDSRV
jgi:hypothetical protein